MHEIGKLSVIEAIHQRRSVRDFTPKEVEREAVRKLLEAAVRAPSASNRQPWAFAVIQDRGVLAEYSAEIKASFPRSSENERFELQYREMLGFPNFNVFYNVGTLVVVYAHGPAPGLMEECCFAAENLMLAACDLGLGTCPIGFARPWFGLPATKAQLGIPSQYEVVLPIVVGYPAALPPATERRDPEILVWKR